MADKLSIFLVTLIQFMLFFWPVVFAGFLADLLAGFLASFLPAFKSFFSHFLPAFLPVSLPGCFCQLF